MKYSRLCDPNVNTYVSGTKQNKKQTSKNKNKTKQNKQTNKLKKQNKTNKQTETKTETNKQLYNLILINSCGRWFKNALCCFEFCCFLLSFY